MHTQLAQRMTQSLLHSAPVLTFQRLDQGIGAGHIAVCANADDRAIGIAIAQIESTLPTARLKSLLVQEPYRHRGIGQRLLGSLEHHARAHGVRRLEATYAGQSPSTQTLSRMLRKAGWHRPSEPAVIFTASTRILEAPWMSARAADKLELFAWSELTARDADELAAARATSPWFPDALGPFPEQPVEPACSVGARHQGRVVGWMLLHRVDARTVRYSRLFVRSECRRQVCGVTLFAEALRRQHAAGIPLSICAVSTGNATMLRIMERRIEPYLESKSEVCFAAKDCAAH